MDGTAQMDGRCQRGHDRQTEQLKVDGDQAELTSLVPQRIKTLEALIGACQIDTNEWEIERWLCNKWDMGSIPRAVGKSKNWSRPSTKPVVTELFQVKVWLKRKRNVLLAKEEIRDLIQQAKAKFPARPQLAPAATGSHMLEINIPDLHVGKLAWSPETLGPNYDGDIAEETFERALACLIERTKSFSICEILFVLGNDLLHSDTKAGTTTSGTPLDIDSRFQKNFRRVRQMSIRATERLRRIAPVRVVIVSGNHDTLATWCLGDSLECYYHETADVTVDNAPSMRKYYQYGKVMLMFTHGNRGKLADYPLLMATERPEMFGATLYREAHTGDKHQLKVQEHHGVRVRILPALCPPDAWHSEYHFVGNQRAAEAFVWHKDEGLVGTAVFTATEDLKAA